MQGEASMGLPLLSNRANSFSANLSKFGLEKLSRSGRHFSCCSQCLLEVFLQTLALTEVREDACCLDLLLKVSQQSRQSCVMLYWEWGASLSLPAGWRAQRGECGRTACVLPAPTAQRQEDPYLLPCSFVPFLSSNTCCSTHSDPCFGVGI